MKKKQSIKTIKTILFDKTSITFGIIYGLILGTTFSIIDNVLFLIAEEHITTFLERSIHNRNIIGLIESSFSAAIAFFIASYFEKKAHKSAGIFVFYAWLYIAVRFAFNPGLSISVLSGLFATFFLPLFVLVLINNKLNFTNFTWR